MSTNALFNLARHAYPVSKDRESVLSTLNVTKRLAVPVPITKPKTPYHNRKNEAVLSSAHDALLSAVMHIPS